VQVLPFLAESIIPYSNAQSWLQDIQPEGVASLKVQDLTGMLSMKETRDNPDMYAICWMLILVRSCPFSALLYLTDNPVDVCRPRASFIDGEFILIPGSVN
jgi:hypothetical protein